MSTTTAAVPDKELDDDEILLTDAERAGMEDADEDELDPKPEAEAKPEATTEELEAAKGEPDPEADPDAGDDFQPANVPPLKAGDTATAKTRMEEIEAERDRLARDFDDGEMTAVEYREANAKLEREHRDLEWTLRKAELSQEMSAQAAEAAWYSEVGAFLNEHKTVLKPGSLVLQAFDIAVRQVTGDQANDSLSNRQKLEKAYDALRADMGLAAAPKPAAQPAPKPAPKPAMRDLPPNLKNVPAADLESTDNGTFAVLDRLLETDPLAYEDRLSKMSESEVEAYLRSR